MTETNKFQPSEPEFGQKKNLKQ